MLQRSAYGQHSSCLFLRLGSSHAIASTPVTLRGVQLGQSNVPLRITSRWSSPRNWLDASRPALDVSQMSFRPHFWQCSAERGPHTVGTWDGWNDPALPCGHQTAIAPTAEVLRRLDSFGSSWPVSIPGHHLFTRRHAGLAKPASQLASTISSQCLIAQRPSSTASRCFLKVVAFCFSNRILSMNSSSLSNCPELSMLKMK